MLGLDSKMNGLRPIWIPMITLRSEYRPKMRIY